MPTFGKLTSEEVAGLAGRRGQQKMDLPEYEDFLEQLDVGEWGRITLEADEKQRTIKRRLSAAGKQIGKTLKYRRAPEGQLVVEVEPTFSYPTGDG